MKEKSSNIPGNNGSVIRMLSREFGKYNKKRNRILMAAVALCIVTLTMVFGIAFGKVQAEYMRAVRMAGTSASACIAGASREQYEEVRSLSYVKRVGRSVSVGEAVDEEGTTFRVQVLDKSAWEEIVKPAYTDINGHYPVKEQEIMLPVKSLKAMGIQSPREGMELKFTVHVGLFQTETEEFSLSGWYTDHMEGQPRGIGYISEEKYRRWGYDIRRESDLVICQSDSMDWQEAEQRLYEDVKGSSGLKVTVRNPFAYDAVGQLAGGYSMAVLGAFVIFGGMFFLIYNIMGISMAGDIRQMGLINTIGATRKQIRRIYYGQIQRALQSGILAGTALSAVVLKAVVPEILGRQYLSRLGGAGEVRFFRWSILIAAVVFAGLITSGISACVIYRVVNASCVESIGYTDVKSKRKKDSGKVHSIKNHKRRSADRELCVMARQNLTRYRGRFFAAVFSIFLGMAAFLSSVVITDGSDYVHVIEQCPDFLIAGEFSQWGQQEGYGNEYKTRDPGEDMMETKGSSFCLLYGNDYDEFSPVSDEAREKLLSIDGVKQETSYVMEGAYMFSTVSRKGIRPFITDYNENVQVKEGIGYDEEYSMVESANEDVLQILGREEIKELREYAENHHLPVDMDSLENGTGVMLLHDHMLSPEQEKAAEESVGEPVYFTAMWSKEQLVSFHQMTPDERDAAAEAWDADRKRSEEFSLCGYMDNRAEGFPAIQQSWHGSEGMVYYLISEEGFAKLPTEKKTLYMELDVEDAKEPEVKREIQNIILEENQRRAELPGTAEDEEGEAGIFMIGKSDLLAEAENYIRGNRTILGSISAVLLFAGLTNYFNVMVTGMISRRKEFEVMESIGMTKRQKRRLVAMEGLYYCLIVTALTVTAGSVILRLICIYMERRLSYFTFHYPIGWLAVMAGALAAICLAVPELLCGRLEK